MEVVVPILSNNEFDFNSARSSPFATPPLTPKRFGEYYFSAPTSPTQLSQIYRDFDDFLVISSSHENDDEEESVLGVPFAWEERPGKPKLFGFEDHDFAFDVSEEMETASLSAEELFDGGIIKALKPPPRLQIPDEARIGESSSAQKDQRRSPRSPIFQGTKMIKDVILSPRGRNRADPSSMGAQGSSRRTPERERGRERISAGLYSSSSRRATRSLSPMRVSQYPWEEEQQQQQQQSMKQSSNMISSKPASSSSNGISLLNSSSKGSGSKKWRLKDFFLFRSASEGRAADKDPLKKYTAAFRRVEDLRHSSFRAIESPGGSSRRRGQVSAHELHYTVNKAVSEDLKKKTFLPYKQGILGRLAFNPAVHALANGFGLSRK